MKLLKLALRNLFRNGRRTLLTLAAVAFGLAMMIWTVNFQTGQYGAMIRTSISSMAGHIVIQPEGYQEDPEPTLLVKDASVISEALRTAYPDAVVAPRIFMGGLLMSVNNSVGAGISGMHAEAEAQIQSLPDKLVEGSWLGTDPVEILIGKAMAESLQVGLGDKLVYMGQNGEDEVQSRLFRVRGIFETGGKELDGFVGIAHLQATQELLGGGDVANMVTVHMDPDEALEAVAEVQRLIERPELDVRHWKDALPELFALLAVDRASGDFMLAIIGLIVAFGVLNTLLMSVLERTREFGVMLALGMKPRQIAQLVLFEGLVLGLLGAILGLCLGLLLTWPTVVYGMDFSAYSGGQTMESAGVAIDTLMKAEWNPSRMAFYFFGAIGFCALAALYPAWSISKLRPVQALRHI
jgi:putative ABC transport system permease protein